MSQNKIFLASRKISKYPNLICGALLNNYGTLQFGSKIKKKQVLENRKKYFTDLGINHEKVVLQDQIHSANIKEVNLADRGRGVLSEKDVILANDGLITCQKDIFLGVFTADCVPVSFFDPKTYALGIAHAGWKGTLKLIAKKMVLEMKSRYRVKSHNLLCYLGPAIGNCCYEVSKVRDRRVDKFLHRFGPQVIKKRGAKIFLDLKQAIELQLLSLGVLKKNIEISPICTCCSKLNLPSYRRDKTSGSILSIIGIKD